MDPSKAVAIKRLPIKKANVQIISSISDKLSVEEPLEVTVCYGSRDQRCQKNISVTMRDGRSAVTTTEMPDHILSSDDYLMAITQIHDQFNTTIYGLDDRYRGIKNEWRVIFMSEKDIKSAGFKAGDRVDLSNYDDDVERIAPLFIRRSEVYRRVNKLHNRQSV